MTLNYVSRSKASSSGVIKHEIRTKLRNFDKVEFKLHGLHNIPEGPCLPVRHYDIVRSVNFFFLLCCK
jgi:hypothetical protein